MTDGPHFCLIFDIIASPGLTLRTRIWIAFATAGLLLFGGYGAYHLRIEERDLRAALEREVAFLGRAIQVSMENALRDRQLEDVRQTLTVLEALDPTVDILVFDASGGLTAWSEGSLLRGPARERVAEHVLRTRRAMHLFYPEDEPRLLVAGRPLRSAHDNGSLGAVIIVRPLDEMRRDLSVTRRNILLVVLGFVLLTGAIGAALTSLYLRRPLARIVEGMRRVRAGELQSTLAIPRDDEIGEVAREFNIMVEDLREARQRLLVEADLRMRMERGLRHVDKLVTIGQLAAGLAHEIGSPLQVLSGRARALRARAHEPAEVQRNAEILIEQSERITRVVEHLLHFVRRRAASLVSFDLVPVIRRVVEFIEPECRRREVDLAMDSDDGPILVEADPDQMQQVVLNLLTNALAATPPGGRIHIEVARAGMALPGSERTVPAVRLRVTDTGCGVPEALLPRLFEPFFTTRAAEGGTGLGLAVIQGIVDEHGGAIAIDSAPGEGTRVVVELPERGRSRARA